MHYGIDYGQEEDYTVGTLFDTLTGSMMVWSGTGWMPLDNATEAEAEMTLQIQRQQETIEELHEEIESLEAENAEMSLRLTALTGDSSTIIADVDRLSKRGWEPILVTPQVLSFLQDDTAFGITYEKDITLIYAETE